MRRCHEAVLVVLFVFVPRVGWMVTKTSLAQRSIKKLQRFAGTCYKYMGGADDIEFGLLPSPLLSFFPSFTGRPNWGHHQALFPDKVMSMMRSKVQSFRAFA